MQSTWSVPCLLLIALLALPQAAQAEPLTEAKITVSATIDTSELALSGRFVIQLTFVVQQAVDRPCQVRLAVVAGDQVLFRRDHLPPKHVHLWKEGETIRYDVPSQFPLNMLDAELSGELDVYVGLRDATRAADDAEGRVQLHGSSKTHDMMRHIGSFAAPKSEGGLSESEEEAVIARARGMKKKDPRAAWDELDYAIRRSDDYPQKIRLRKEMEALGHFPPRPLTRIELLKVQHYIRDEKTRYLRELAGKMMDQGQLLGARRLLMELGGSLQEHGKEAVIGSVADAKRATADAKNLKHRIIKSHLKKDEAILAELEKVKAWRNREKLITFAKGLIAKGHRGAAWEALRRAKDSGSETVRELAKPLREELEADMLDDITQEEIDRIEAGKTHEAFDRLYWGVSHRFIYIGPKAMVEGILKNKNSTRRLDLAYTFQTDLFNRSPNAGGTRITVFFKELWDFGGGQARGSHIDIGRAKPDKTNYRVDTGLMYHELTHCVYRFQHGFAGFNEGIANVGATFSYDVLGQGSSSDFDMRRNLEAFRNDFVARDVDFWRIHKYGPSAGFFLHFIDAYGRKGKRLDWQLYRRFFREFNRCKLRDMRPRSIIRPIAFYFMRTFGDEALDDLIKFGFPLEESDRQALADEVRLGDGKLPEWVAQGGGFDRHPNSPANRDALHKRFVEMRGANPTRDKLQAFGERWLGINYTWKVCGPFLANTDASLYESFPPEKGVFDYKARYECPPKHTAIWRDPSTTDSHKYVYMQPDGWCLLQFPYGKNTSSYAYARLVCERAGKGRLHLRSDDHMTVFFNGELLLKMRNMGGQGSGKASYRAAKVPDEMTVPLELKAGENVLLLKITNGDGPAGFIAAITDTAGRPLPGLKIDTQPPVAGSMAMPTAPKWKGGVSYEGKAMRAIKAAVGKAKTLTRDKTKNVLVGTSKGKGVRWRPYDVHPGFPKDSPSNLFWLPARTTKKLGDFMLAMDLVLDKPSLPKLALTYDGEGGKCGLSGWTLILSPSRDRKSMTARLEKYDHVYYTSARINPKQSNRFTLVVLRVGSRVQVKLGDAVLFDGVSTPRLPGEKNTHVGFTTWGQDTGVSGIRLVRR